MKRFVRSTALVAYASVISACATVGGAGGSSLYSLRDERRVVGSFADVRAVGISRRFVYAATSGGIAVYDRLFNSWQAPIARDAGLVDAQITFMTGDPTEDAVWIGVPGGVLIYRPQSEQMQRAMVVGVPEVIVFDRTPGGDAYVRASGQWARVSRIGTSTLIAGPPSSDKLIAPRSLNDVYARYPGIRSGAPLLFRNHQSDRPLQSFPIVSGTFSDDAPNDVWLGTSGDGLYKFDATLQQATALRYGLIEYGVGALALAADGVWTAGLGVSQTRSGLTFASNDLQRWRWIEGTIAVPMLGMRATSMSLRARYAWIGTDRGVVRAQLDGTEALTVWNTLDGLPDDRVNAVAARADGAWIGTARGLVFIQDSVDSRASRNRDEGTRRAGARGVGVSMLDNTPVYALQPIGDTLWIGSAAGLVALPASGALARPIGADPALRRRITALAWSDTVLLAAGDDGVLALAPKGGKEPTRVTELNVALVGQVTKLAMDDRAIVMTGTDGAIVMQRGGVSRVLRVGSDLPGPALDVAMSRDWIWIATPQGLVRLRRASSGGLP